MARAKAQPPRRLTPSQLRSLASRGQTGRSTIRAAAVRQRSAVARESLRQRKPPQRIVRRTISDSVSVRQPRQEIQPTFRSTSEGGRVKSSSTFRRIEISRRQPLKRVKQKTRASSIGKPAPRVATRGQQRQRQSVARQPFILNFANVSEKARDAKDVVFTSLFKGGLKKGAKVARRREITRTVTKDTPFGINFGRVSDDGIVNTPQEFADFFVEPSDQQREAIQTARGFKQPRVSGAGSGPINFLDDFLGGRA